jgi:hypothetical protein
MQLFNLEWNWYEESNPYLFVHPDKTEEQFKEDVKFLLQKYGEEYMEQEESWIGAHNWVYYISKKMPDLGYEPVNPITESFWGAYIIENKKGDEDKSWGEVVGEKLLEIAIDKNKKFRETTF